MSQNNTLLTIALVWLSILSVVVAWLTCRSVMGRADRLQRRRNIEICQRSSTDPLVQINKKLSHVILVLNDINAGQKARHLANFTQDNKERNKVSSKTPFVQGDKIVSVPSAPDSEDGD